MIYVSAGLLVVIAVLLLGVARQGLDRRRKRSRFVERERWEETRILADFYREPRSSEPVLVMAWREAVSVVPLDPSILRPADSFRDLGTAMTPRENARHLDLFARLIREKGRAEHAPAAFRTLDDLVQWLMPRVQATEGSDR
jgi:hypothetical protein